MLVSIGNGIIDNKTVFPISEAFVNNTFNGNNSGRDKYNNKNNYYHSSILNPLDGSISVKLPNLKYIQDKVEAINFVFPQLFISTINNNNNESEIYAKSAILCATNEFVDEWNDIIQQLNTNDLKILKSTDIFDYVDDNKGILQNMITEDILHKYNKVGFPCHNIKLKVGDICFIMRNLLKKQGLTNNTRVKLTQIKKYSIRVCTIDTDIIKFFTIPRIPFKVTLSYGRSFTMIRKQFPLRLAYSMTYNKSQGQELKKCLVDIRSPPFVHGHLYVSLSRIRFFDNIRIFCTNDNIDNDDCIVVKNYIYNQLKI
jgi:hypothetical protein